MADATGTATDHLVTFHADGHTEQHQAIITLIDGYTTEADIPRIVALRFGGLRQIVVDSVQPYVRPSYR